MEIISGGMTAFSRDCTPQWVRIHPHEGFRSNPLSNTIRTMANPLFANSAFISQESRNREPWNDVAPVLQGLSEPPAFSLNCSDCTWLTNEYERLERVRLIAAQTLTTRGLAGSARDYIALHAAADEARMNSGNALLELQRHWGVHRKTLLMAFRTKSRPDGERAKS
jgi:hypothetical protein